MNGKRQKFFYRSGKKLDTSSYNQKLARRPLLFYVGNVLMMLSLFFILFIYYPFLLLFIFPEKIQTYNGREFYIQIPRIHAQAPIIENVDPWNESLYQKDLKNGVAHAKGTVLPGKKGTIFLFAHSSDYPWNITRYNTAFFRLGELKNEDQVKLYKDGKEFEYKIFDKKVVSPTDVQYLKNTDKEVLILQTCTPIGTSFQRLLIFAHPV